MTRVLKTQNMKQWLTQGWISTYEGAPAYDYSDTHPLIHLVFTMGSALFTDGFYETEQAQVRTFAQSLLRAAQVDPKFPWQYAAWMRDPKRGKGNRIQGSLAPALLDALLPKDLRDEAIVAQYTALALSHRPDDVTACLTHYERLGLGRPSKAVRQGMALALTKFDEYQLLKYTGSRQKVRLCDVILMVREELEALSDGGALALAVGRYLHAPTRSRKDHPSLDRMHLTRARRALWAMPPSGALSPELPLQLEASRVTWEQVLSHFGAGNDPSVKRRRKAVWSALLSVRGLVPDTALLRNVRNMVEAGVSADQLTEVVSQRRFDKVWPHQVYAGYKAAPQLGAHFEAIFSRTLDRLPLGRHLGIADASGSMMVKVGGSKGSLNAMDVALCFTAIMSESSGLGASFSDGQFAQWSGGKCLSIAARGQHEGALKFAQNPALRRGMGGTQVFGAVMELIKWLVDHPEVTPPDCLWFFSDMQFHPAAGALKSQPNVITELSKIHGVSLQGPPLEAALKLYRKAIGPVDVVLWNLAAYAPVPVPADMEGVLLVSGFDTNTFDTVSRWRQGLPMSGEGAPSVEESQEIVLDKIRAF
ncbi:MAG: TROVE domain-containing protein [Bradymonadia bacterium]